MIILKKTTLKGAAHGMPFGVVFFQDDMAGAGYRRHRTAQAQNCINVAHIKYRTAQVSEDANI